MRPMTDTGLRLRLEVGEGLESPVIEGLGRRIWYVSSPGWQLLLHRAEPLPCHSSFCNKHLSEQVSCGGGRWQPSAEAATVAELACLVCTPHLNALQRAQCLHLVTWNRDLFVIGDPLPGRTELTPFEKAPCSCLRSDCQGPGPGRRRGGPAVLGRLCAATGRARLTRARWRLPGAGVLRAAGALASGGSA